MSDCCPRCGCWDSDADNFSWAEVLPDDPDIDNLIQERDRQAIDYELLSADYKELKAERDSGSTKENLRDAFEKERAYRKAIQGRVAEVAAEMLIYKVPSYVRVKNWLYKLKDDTTQPSEPEPEPNIIDTSWEDNTADLVTQLSNLNNKVIAEEHDKLLTAVDSFLAADVPKMIGQMCIVSRVALEALRNARKGSSKEC